jgi:hypothetical protein
MAYALAWPNPTSTLIVFPAKKWFAWQDLASQQALGMNGVQYDAKALNYLGRAATNVPLHMVWHTSPVKTIDEIKKREITTAAGSRSPRNHSNKLKFLIFRRSVQCGQ